MKWILVALDSQGNVDAGSVAGHQNEGDLRSEYPDHQVMYVPGPVQFGHRLSEDQRARAVPDLNVALEALMGPGTDAPVLDFAPWTQTASGIRLDLLSPQPDMFTREDIAAGLSHAARFSGQTGRFFSVAQHSLLVSALVKAWGHTPEVQLLGLLHDAQEAYLCDLARPVKVLVPGYKELELRLWAAIRERFGLDDLPPEVKDADNAALHAEAWELLGPPAGDWAGPQAEASLQTVPDARHWLNAVLTPQEARSAFLQRWAELEGPSAADGKLN